MQIKRPSRDGMQWTNYVQCDHIKRPGANPVLTNLLCITHYIVLCFAIRLAEAVSAMFPPTAQGTGNPAEKYKWMQASPV